MRATEDNAAPAPASAAPCARLLASLLALAYLGLALHVLSLEQGRLLRGPVLALFGLGALLSLGAALGPRRARARLLALTVAGSLALAAAELVESRWGPAAPVRLPDGYDRRTKRQMVLDLRAEGLDAWPSFPCDPVGPVPRFGGRPTLPLAGISRVLTVHDNDNETGEFKLFQSDRHGFNNPDEVWTLAPLELALVGDSFTFGASVREGRCFADLVRARHPATINLGTPGMGPLRELGVVREYLPYLRPRLVLWFWYEGNDVENLESARENEVLQRYLDEEFSQDLVARQPSLDTWMKNRVGVLLEGLFEDAKSRARHNDERLALGRRLELEALQRHLSEVLASRPQEVLAADPAGAFPRELVRRILDQARRVIARWDGELVFVYLPGYASLERGTRHPHRPALVELLRELDLALIDLWPPFREHDDFRSLFPFRRRGHYGESGNELVAREVLAWIERRP